MDPDICVGGEGPDRRAAGPNPELTGQRDRVERFWIRNQDRYFIRILYIQRVRVETPRLSGEIPMVRIRNPWGNETEWNGSGSEIATVTLNLDIIHSGGEGPDWDAPVIR